MGTFVMLRWHPCSGRSWRDLFCLKAIRLNRGRPHSQPVGCDQCTFHIFDPKQPFDYCWMDKINKSTWHFSLIYESKKNPLILDLHPMSEETKDKWETKLNNRRVIMMAACSCSVFFLWFFFFCLFFSPLECLVFFFFFFFFKSCQLDCETGMVNTSLPLPSLPVLSAE